MYLRTVILQDYSKERSMFQLIDGKSIAAQIKEEVKEEAERLKQAGIQVCLAVVQVGNDPASSVYVRNKKKACEYVGIRSASFELPEDTAEDELLELVRRLNEDDSVNGILVQLPLPEHISEDKVIQTISPDKDVDGFHPESVGRLCIGEKGFLSCTPAGIIELLRRSGVEIQGKECVVVGRSNIVGKPMALLLLKENGTVTIAHSRTADLKEITQRADILIVAIGRPRFITADYVKEGATVIDVGIHRNEDGHLCGDVDFDNVKEKTAFITPVPGGVGPMTIAMLMKNCIAAAK
jgi:5,10-methylene-tetrahydrofolate dehydrogenase/Methenyl tetrahydrofolate cyclohydrolase